MLKILPGITVLTLASLLVVSCMPTHKRNKYNLVEDEKTGYSYGSIKAGEFLADPAMFRNSKLKLRIRNTTGDPSLNIYSFRQQLMDAYENVGYEMTSGDDFGILLDVNVKYFGQITDALPVEYSFLGGVAGSAIGMQSVSSSNALAGLAAGFTVGAALTEIIRQYATDETFIIISSITMATVMPEHIEDQSTLTFVTGKKIRDKKTNFRGFRSRNTVDLAVYAGGFMAGKSDIIDEVRERHLRILQDII